MTLALIYSTSQICLKDSHENEGIMAEMLGLVVVVEYGVARGKKGILGPHWAVEYLHILLKFELLWTSLHPKLVEGI